MSADAVEIRGESGGGDEARLLLGAAAAMEERARRRRRNIEDAVMAVVAFGAGAFFFAGFAWGFLKWALGL